MTTNEIKEQYGQLWQQVEDAYVGNGWISVYKKDWGDITPRLSKMDLQHSGMFWRLNQLRSLPDLHTTLKQFTNDTTGTNKG